MSTDRSTFGGLNPEELAFEAALAALRPRQSIDRDRLMFLAGQASTAMPQRGRIAGRWTLAAASLAVAAALVAAFLAGTLTTRMPPAPVGVRVAEQMPEVAVPVADSSSTAAPVLAARSPAAFSPAEGADSAGRRPVSSPLRSTGSLVGRDYLDLRGGVLSHGVEWLSMPEGPDRPDAQEQPSLLEMRSRLLDPDRRLRSEPWTSQHSST